MRTLKSGLLAAAALAFGMIASGHTASANDGAAVQLAQGTMKPADHAAMQAKPKMTRSAMRAEREAKERAMTKQLNEAQLKK